MTEPQVRRATTLESSGQGVATERLLLEEAWGIAIDLRSDLGLPNAIDWADAYLDEVREREDSAAVARWAVVISALAELKRSSVH